MLRVEFQDVGETLTMRLQGRFVGPFAKDTRDLVTRRKHSAATCRELVGDNIRRCGR